MDTESSQDLWHLIPDNERLRPEHFLAIRDDGLTFAACLHESAGVTELMREFDRLYGASLVSRTTPIGRMVDETTGKRDEDMQAFLRFVWNSVFLRVPPIRK